MTWAYYNENDAHCAEWLFGLMRAGLIAPGMIDTRSIQDVQPDDLKGFRQAHFFAGIGVWSYAARQAGWPDDRELWTGSCPCQPFSVAGKGRGSADERHLWPDLYRLVQTRRPTVLMGEQVARKAGKAWFAGVRADLERGSYAARGTIVPACAVGAPHERERLFFVADANAAKWRAGAPGWHDSYRKDTRRQEGSGDAAERGAHVSLADTNGERRTADGVQLRSGRQDKAATQAARASAGRSLAEAAGVGQREPHHSNSAIARQGARDRVGRAGVRHGEDASFWSGSVWIDCADGKQRRVEPSIHLLADGPASRVAGALSGFGNAIVAEVAKEVIAAYLEAERG